MPTGRDSGRSRLAGRRSRRSATRLHAHTHADEPVCAAGCVVTVSGSSASNCRTRWAHDSKAAWRTADRAVRTKCRGTGQPPGGVGDSVRIDRRRREFGRQRQYRGVRRRVGRRATSRARLRRSARRFRSLIGKRGLDRREHRLRLAGGLCDGLRARTIVFRRTVRRGWARPARWARWAAASVAVSVARWRLPRFVGRETSRAVLAASAALSDSRRAIPSQARGAEMLSANKHASTIRYGQAGLCLLDFIDSSARGRATIARSAMS